MKVKQWTNKETDKQINKQKDGQTEIPIFEFEKITSHVKTVKIYNSKNKYFILNTIFCSKLCC